MNGDNLLNPDFSREKIQYLIINNCLLYYLFVGVTIIMLTTTQT